MFAGEAAARQNTLHRRNPVKVLLFRPLRGETIKQLEPFENERTVSAAKTERV